MEIILYNNESPKNRINKTISEVAILTGILRAESDAVTPEIEIAMSDFPSANYAYIQAFGRYYYLTDVRQIRASIWRLKLKSDPLMSFDLSDVSGILIESENIGSPYLSHPHFIRTVKSKTDIIQFPNGLLDTGEYILITAGGIAT